EALFANTILTNQISPLIYTANDSVTVPFTATGTYLTGNIFGAQLSDASGNFSSPTSIGTLTSTQSGTITATIPIETPAGTQYRIRVVSSNPSTTGTDNGQDITINPLSCDVPSGEYTDAIKSTSAKIHWSAVAAANKYKIQYRVTGTTTWSKTSSSNTYKK